MHKDVIMKYMTALLLFALFTSTFGGQDALTVIHSGHAVYTSIDGESATVDYYLLSDSTLHFIKLLLPGSEEYTLPQTVSGSGVRYSDGMDMTWWERADSAMIQRRDTLGNWQTTVTLRLDSIDNP